MRTYLDHNAGAPMRAEALSAMAEVLGTAGNPSSAHREGARARALLETARARVAALIGARPAEIVFTSGATEANNLALRGTTWKHIVVAATEHASVLETARAIAPDAITVIRVDDDGRVSADHVIRACGADAVLASVGLANGEVGAVAPIAAIATGLTGRATLLHTDAAQAAGRIPVDVHALGIDLLSLSSHKLGGPAGVGALWVRPGTALVPQATGGPQERGLRAGTENIAAVVGFGVAAEMARAELDVVPQHLAALIDRLWDGIRARVPDVVRNGPSSGTRLPNTLNVRFPGCAGESLLVLLDLAGIAVSLGSACAAGAAEPSHVLVAMGQDRDAARSAIRLSIGPSTTDGCIAHVLDTLPAAVAQVRGRSAA